MVRVVPRPLVAPVGRRSVVHARRPIRAAVLSLVTVSIYGFWWWWDLNRQLKALGQPARPWKALGLVTLGWLVVLPALWANWMWVVVALSALPIGMSLVAVQQTAAMVAAAQRTQGAGGSVSDTVAVGLAATALAGVVAWFALSVLTIPSGLMVGVAWPLVAVVLVSYLQAGFNNAVRGDRSSTPPVSTS